MRTPLEQGILEIVRRERLLAAGDRVGVAVSGGADSVALLRLLERVRGELGIVLAILHFDHMLRGAESDGDARFVADLAQKAGLECILGREDVAAAAARNGWNLEDASRRLRYAFFERVVGERRATRVAVAHTADDQAETVLAHLIRGTGPAGLCGIYPAAGCVVRPLLRARRDELRGYLREIKQEWREDSTNQDLSRSRARIRAELLPFIERRFSASIAGHLGELARLSREEGDFWNALVADRFRTLVRTGAAGIEIQIADLMRPLRLSMGAAPAPPGSEQERDAPVCALAERPVTERLIRRLYVEVKGDRRGLTARHVEQVIHLATETEGGGAVELPGGAIARRDFGVLTFSRNAGTRGAGRSGASRITEEASAGSASYEYVLVLPGHGQTALSVPELGTRFLLKVIDWTSREAQTSGDGEVLDADLVCNPLVLRNWRPGDAYRPHGYRSRRKLKQLFQVRRVAGPERAGWPVIESAGRLIWARGLPAAEDVLAREGTRIGVLIQEERG